MEPVEIIPNLHLLPLGISNAYLWHDGTGATLIDTGPPGSASAISGALEHLGLQRSDLRRIVLTHCHDDHAGSAAEVASWDGAPVVAARAEAAFIRGDEPAPPFELTEAERALHAVVAAGLAPAPACAVDVEVQDGDVLDFAGGAAVLLVPGHTPGSLALHLPRHGVLLAGDTIAEHQGQIVLGPFNTDRALAWASLQRLGALEVEVACFGHGEPVLESAGRALRTAIDPFV